MVSEELFQIDVRRIIGSKNPKILKRIPGFVIRYLERIVHQKEFNEFLRNNPEKKDLEFIAESLSYLEIKVEFEGLENIPSGGRYVFASNHPLGGLESIVLMQTVATKFDKFVFVVNDILMSMKPVSGLFIPVNKHGSQSRESVKNITKVYNSENQILFFPAGLVSRKIKGKIVDPPWQKSFVSKAIESKRDIVPVFINGRNSKFFYRLANLRKFFRIKTNIEMLYLVDEMFNHKGRTIRVTFGEPISYITFDKSKSNKEWAAFLQGKVYSLSGNLTKR